MIFEVQMSVSSVRQLSILSEPACAAASPAIMAASAAPAVRSFLCVFVIRLSCDRALRPLLKVLGLRF